jgi:subtilisin family serine protease
VGVDRAGEGIKIAIIDSGIDIDHKGFQDASLKPPEGYPKTNAEGDVKFTNGKVIVARSYVSMFSTPDPDESPRDHIGHGTATAMAAAGAFNTGPLASITGVAPKAFLGSYKVFGSPGVNESTQTDIVLKAIDDAVADGMDVINLSLGSLLAQRPEEDIEVRALERAAQLGVIVVVAAGNEGNDPNTIGSPGTAPSIITVGASRNDRVFAASASVEGLEPRIAIPGSGVNSAIGITAPLRDVAALDNDGLACAAFAADSLKDRIAFILRGTCTFEEKLNNAAAAGAVAALVYTDAARPSPIGMDVRAAKLPALMVSNPDGAEIKKRLAASSSLAATLKFTIGPLYINADGVAIFSAVGPSVVGGIKPDLVAVGTNFYTAAETNDPEGFLYDLLGYTLTQGTSFSSPLVAGGAAVVKSARRGLTSAQYRSLLVNYAAPVSGATVQESGAGKMDLGASLRGTAAMAPVSLSFGATGEADVTRSLTISNVGTAQETFQLSFAPRAGTPPPSATVESVRLAPGASTEVKVRFAPPNARPGGYEGYVRVLGLTSGVEARVPYWFAIPSTAAKYITVLDSRDRARRATVVNRAILFRVTDSAGVPLKEPDTKITATTGDGELVRIDSLDSRYPGVWAASVRLGPQAGPNVFEIKVGDVKTQVVIVGQ